MDDDKLIEQLLYKGEGAALDYKSRQYPFSGASDDEKSELLKDILSFVNSWRSETAYILIGVKDGAEDLVELDVDIDDSRLQQFINGKTVRPIHFSYKSVMYRGVRLGLYSIPQQDRPVFIKKKYGKVEPNTVYVRRGSSTAIADPIEIAKMGSVGATVAAVSQTLVPRFTVKVVGPNDSVCDIFSHSYKGWVMRSMDQYLLIAHSNNFQHRNLNPLFYKEMASYLSESSGKVSVSLEVSNCGEFYAEDVKLRLSFPTEVGAYFKEGLDLLVRPKRMLPEKLRPMSPRVRSIFEIKNIGKEHVLTISMGKFQAGEVKRTPKIYLLNARPELACLEVAIMSDQLRGAVKLLIPAEITVEAEELTMEYLKKIP